MLGLLGVETSYAKPQMHLGYRRARQRQSGAELAIPFLGSYSLSQLPVQFEPAKYERMVFGLILILMMIFRPQGILPPRQEQRK